MWVHNMVLFLFTLTSPRSHSGSVTDGKTREEANKYSTNYIFFHGIIHLALDSKPSRRRFRTARPRGEVDLHRGQRPSLGARSY